jgi:hypothetical protein
MRLTPSTGIINRISKAEQCKASFAFDGLYERQAHAKAPRRKGTEQKWQKNPGQKMTDEANHEWHESHE